MSADLVRSLGMGARYTRGGKTWPVSPWTIGVQADYILYIKDLVYQDIRSLERRGVVTPDEAAAQKKQVPVDSAAGLYAFGGEYIRSTYQNSLENLSHLFWLMVSANDKDFTLDTSRQCVLDDAQGVAEAIGRANAAPEDPDPNRTTPAKDPGNQSTTTSSSQP